ncbi:MAG: helix-turn-helix domain-containing protein, partial [Vampirovibrionales bacterium]|nr:helix-turn-helix domain-containing protein [Vampirovibrionales bacterium]
MTRKKNSQTWEKVSSPSKKCKKLGNLPGNFVSVKEAAELLGKTRKTVTSMCDRGELTSIPKDYGSTVTYEIPLQAVMLYLDQQKQKELLAEKAKDRKKQMTEHAPYVAGFVRAMEAGLIGKTGKFAKTTIGLYKKQVERYLEIYPSVSFKHFVTYLSQFPEHSGKQMNIYRAILAFSKYLIREGVLDKNFVK